MQVSFIYDLLLSTAYKSYYKSLSLIKPRRYKYEYQFTRDWFSIWIPIWEKHLASLAGQPNISALEIGTFEGRSSLWLLENILTHPSSTLTCIDINFNEQFNPYKRFLQNLAIGGFTSRTTTIEGDSMNVLPTLNNKRFNLIYIDGSHTEEHAYSDTTACWELLAPGGIMIIDDYLLHPLSPYSSRPKHGVDRYLKEYIKYLEILHNGYQLVTFKKVDN